jgi:hypothetical protein
MKGFFFFVDVAFGFDLDAFFAMYTLMATPKGILPLGLPQN